MSKNKVINLQEEKERRDSGSNPDSAHGTRVPEENPAEISEIIREVLKLSAPSVESAAQIKGVVPYGACSFCGQITDTTALGLTTSVDADEYASRRCQCPGAQTYQSRIKRAMERERDLERAREQIDAMFGQGAGGYGMLPVIDETRDYMYNGAVDIYDNRLRDITINIGEGIKVKIAKNAKGNLKISRQDTSTFSQEV